MLTRSYVFNQKKRETWTIDEKETHLCLSKYIILIMLS